MNRLVDALASSDPIKAVQELGLKGVVITDKKQLEASQAPRLTSPIAPPPPPPPQDPPPQQKPVGIQFSRYPEAMETYPTQAEAVAAIDRILDRDRVMRVTFVPDKNLHNKRKVCSEFTEVTFLFGFDPSGKPYEIPITLIIAPRQQIRRGVAATMKIERRIYEGKDGKPFRMDSVWLDDHLLRK
jgi:hypothetical protein